MRILFVCKDRNDPNYPGGTYGLWNSASFVVKELVELGYEAKLVSVFDANGIDREVHRYKPDVCILEAIWVTPDKLKQLARLHKTVEWVVRIHSKSTFLANEGIAFEWMNEYDSIPNVVLAPNNSDFYYDLLKLRYNVVYLPNIYNASYDLEKRQDKNPAILDVGCFGSLRPMKNQLTQAIAAIRYADNNNLSLRFHINSTRHEQNGQNVLRNIRALFNFTEHELVEHRWLSHRDFCQLVVNMDLGMQVSLNESFNIVTADFVSQNVPVVTSPEITFVSSMFTATPTDTNKIMKAMDWALWGYKLGLHKLNKRYLESYNKNAVGSWLYFLMDRN